MKIDYELVEEIGATHYNISSGSLYKVKSPYLLVYSTGNWECSGLSKADIVSLLKPIPPKPQVRVEYEKVSKDTISLEDLMRELLDGVRFYNGEHCGGHYPSQTVLRKYIERSDSLYRRIEKTVDWQSDVVDYIYGNYTPTNHDALSESLVTAISSGIDFKYLTQEEFLGICRVALRANGEL